MMLRFRKKHSAPLQFAKVPSFEDIRVYHQMFLSPLNALHILFTIQMPILSDMFLTSAYHMEFESEWLFFLITWFPQRKMQHKDCVFGLVIASNK
jgi:hypothetical protein